MDKTSLTGSLDLDAAGLGLSFFLPTIESKRSSAELTLTNGFGFFAFLDGTSSSESNDDLGAAFFLVGLLKSKLSSESLMLYTSESFLSAPRAPSSSESNSMA